MLQVAKHDRSPRQGDASREGAAERLPRTDEQLLLDYRDRGDRQAFAELVHRYERELFSYLRRYLGDAEMADDVFQATFMQVHAKLKHFDEDRRFRPWLYRIATNQAIDYQRRNRRHKLGSLDWSGDSSEDDAPRLGALLASTESGPAERVETEEQRRWVRDQIERLSEPLRSVVMMVYYQGLKYREVGDALSIPVGTVKSRMHTALNQLNQAWDEEFGAPR
ncbi:MAG: RNA polymerase sigma factor [Pirellulales bacterium]